MDSSKTGKAGRGYLDRFLRALPAAAAFVLTFFFFGPLETMLANASSLVFNPASAIPMAALISLCGILVGAAVLALFRGKAYGILMALCLAGTLCIYAQNTFMNGSLPELTGDSVDWGGMRGSMIVNAVIWIALFCVPFVLLRFKEIWRYAVILLPVLICVMQLSGFVSVCFRQRNNEGRTGYLGYDQFLDYSAEDNVLVFMLDRLDYNYLDAVLEQDPDFFERLDGFTLYDNAISQFAHTKPAMNFMLTGYDKTLFQENLYDFFLHSWNDGDRHILQDLNEGGYTVDLYADTGLMLGKQYQSFKPYIANLEAKDPKISVKKLTKRIIQLSCYRCAPLALKRYFIFSTSRINNVFKKYAMYETDQSLYDARISKMSTDDEARYFKFYEFSGSHAPYHIQADGSVIAGTTDVVSQTMGSFEILLRAFDRMKELGIYKDTAIIITADHGYAYSDYRPLEHATRIGLFYKPAGAEGTPLQHTNAPVSLRNIPATILKSAGLDYSAYGVPLDEVEDDKSVVRDYIRVIIDAENRSDGLVVLYYDVAYDAADFDSWTLTHTERVPVEMGY